MAEDKILNNERNPKLPQGDGGTTPSGDDVKQLASNNTTNRLNQVLKFAKKHKWKFAAFGGFGGVSATLMMLGSMLSGPMQLIHAGQVIGETIDTARNITTSARIARGITKAFKTFKHGQQAGRIATWMRIPARKLETKILEELGLEAVTSITGVQNGGYKIAGEANQAFLEKLAKEGITFTDGVMDDLSTKTVNRVRTLANQNVSGNKIWNAIKGRSLKKMYGALWYQGITRLTSKAATAIANATGLTKLSTWAEERAAKKAATGMIADAAGTGAKVVAKGSTKVAGKGLKFIPVVGTLAGIAIDYALTMYFDAEKRQEILMAALAKSGEIATASSNIMNGNVPSEDEDGNYVSPQLYMEMLTLQNIYQESQVVDGENTDASYNTFYNASGSDYAYAAEATGCPDLITTVTDSEGNVTQQGNETEVQACIDGLISQSKTDIAEKESSTTTIGSSFFSNAPLEAEFNPNFEAVPYSADYYRGVPPALASIGEDKSVDALTNALVGSITIIGPMDIEEMMAEEFTVDTLSPEQIGGTSMYGARVQQNDLSASEGAEPLTKDAEASLLRETQTYLAEQQMQKPVFARLFDVADYHSGIATLSRDANWNLSDSSVVTQFANVAKTFAALPNLMAKSFGTYTRAASAASPTPYDYGFNMVAHTMASIEAEPDYDDAANFLHDDAHFAQINIDALKKCTGATISKDDDGLRVQWGESNVEKLKLSSGAECGSYYKGTKTFPSHDANGDGELDTGDEKQFNGDEAVRSVLANYQTFAAVAAASADDMTDEELEKDGLNRDQVEKMLIQAMQDMGVTYPSSSSSTDNSSFSDPTAVAKAFEDDTNGSGDHDGAAGRQCVDLSVWFVEKYTTLTGARGSGNGGDVAKGIAERNSLSTSNIPKAPAIFSSRSTKYRANTGTWCSDIQKVCGHTGVILSVNGNTITGIDTWTGSGVNTFTIEWNSSDQVDFLYLGDHLK